MKALDQPCLDALRGDQVALNHLLLAASVNSGDSYMECYEVLQSAAVNDPGATVKDALAGRVKQLGALKDDLRTLEAAARVSAEVQERATRTLDLVPVDEHGRVLVLDQGDLPPRQVASGTPAHGLRVEPASFEEIMNQPTFSERLHRARRLAPGHYDGDAGAQAWSQADRAHAEADLDLLASMERDARIRATQAAAMTASAQLDAAFRQGATPKERRRLCGAAAATALRMLDGEGLG